MATANEDLLDAVLRHQVGLMRVSAAVRKKVQGLLDETEEDLAVLIRRRLEGRPLGLTTRASVRRMRVLIRSLRAIRTRVWSSVNEAWLEDLGGVALAEVAFMKGAVEAVAPVVLETLLPPVGLLNSIARTQPFHGRVLREWTRNVQRADLNRITDQVRIGMVQGETGPAIARRVVGTVRMRGRDGVTEITRRNAATITRTAVNAFSNQAKREFYKANANVISSELYVATLDARTTPICRSLDGKTFPVGRGSIPPLHLNCRSVRVALLDGKVLGDRPFKAATERQLLREYTSRNNLGSVTSRGRLPRGTKGRYDQFRRTRTRELTGRVPARTTYQEWLGRQSVEFQDDVLGRTRGRLFRKGGLTLDKFVDRRGNELTLGELARREKDAFERAGL